MYENAQAQGGGHPFGGFNPNMGGAPGGSSYRTMTPEEMEAMFGGENPFSDFFTTFFGGAGGFAGAEPGARGGRGGRGRKQQQRGRDVEHEIELTLEDAYHGTMRRLGLKHDGHARTVDVRIPAGVGDGSRVRVSGEGEQGVGGAASGDLYLRVRLAPHAVFERKGRDLYVKVALPVPTAVLGGEAEVQTLAGKPARLRIPALTQNGQVFRLKGYGMPAVGTSDEKGDLYARIEAQLPAQVTEDERGHYEALAKSSGAAAKNSAA
jgi:DnaJ-class molecular chaperone